MVGVLVNVIAVVLGSLIGIPIKKGIPKRFSESVMTAISLCVLYIGFSGSLKGQNTLVIIISMIVGVLLGEAVDIDKRFNNLSTNVEKMFSKSEGSFAQGFVSASLLFCVGAMAVVGSLQAGLTGDNQMLYSKSVMDFFAAIVFSSSFGFLSIALSSVTVLVYQGVIALLAHVVSPILTEVVINEMTCIGSLLIMGLGLNLLKITKIKLMNFIPAIFLPIIIYIFI